MEAQLAKRTAVFAFYSRSQLLLIAEGELPSPDYELDIRQAEGQESGIFELRARQRPDPASGPVTPFRYGEIFAIGRPSEHIKLRHASGEDNVPVEHTEEDLVDIVLSLSLEDSQDVEIGGLEAELETSAPAAAYKLPAAVSPGPSASGPSGPSGLSGKPVPILSDISVRYREATGYSNSLSFDEAFADALKKLPPPAVKFPDMLETVEVIHIGGSFGGIAGFRRLEVRVRAYPD